MRHLLSAASLGYIVILIAAAAPQDDVTPIAAHQAAASVTLAPHDDADNVFTLAQIIATDSRLQSSEIGAHTISQGGHLHL